MSWSSLLLALNIGFINQVFLCMLFWFVVLFLTSLAAVMLEWWSWDTFEHSVGCKAGTSFTITILKIQHTMFFWTCCPPTSCSAPPPNHAAHLLLHLLTKQERKIAAGSLWAQPGAAAAVLQLCQKKNRKWLSILSFFPFKNNCFKIFC